MFELRQDFLFPKIQNRFVSCAAAVLAAALTLAAPAADVAAADSAAEEKKLEQAIADALHRIDAELPLRAADETALKKAAERRKVDALAVCGDPGNMPLSNKAREGYQNKIVELIAETIGARVNYFWRPYLERGLTRQTFDSRDCEILLDVPEDYDYALTTEPIYRTTYVFASRTDNNIKIDGFDDPDLKRLKIGVYQTSGLRIALHKHGIHDNVELHLISHDADLKPEKQPFKQVERVLDGHIDIAGIWGPFAGWLKAKGEPLELQPANMMDDETPLEFSLSMGLRRADVILKYKIELALEEKKAEVEQILRDYGVPLVSCSKCYVQGDLPSQGIYQKPLPVHDDENVDRSKMSEDQRVTQARLEGWLEEGADLNVELANAVLGEDIPRVRFLVSQGADVNGLDNQGYAPIHSAARHRSHKMMKALIELGADPNLRDNDGYTAVLHSVLRDHVPSIELLAKHNVDLDARTEAMGDATPLAIAIAEHKLAVAMALIAAGADTNSKNGKLGLTPLMLGSGKERREMTLGAGVSRIRRYDYDPKYPKTLDVVRALLKANADVNAQNNEGVTALMLAAAHNSTPVVGLLLQSGADPDIASNDGKRAADIATENGNDRVVSLIRLITKSAKKNHNPVIR